MKVLNCWKTSLFVNDKEWNVSYRDCYSWCLVQNNWKKCFESSSNSELQVENYGIFLEPHFLIWRSLTSWFDLVFSGVQLSRKHHQATYMVLSRQLGTRKKRGKMKMSVIFRSESVTGCHKVIKPRLFLQFFTVNRILNLTLTTSLALK